MLDYLEQQAAFGKKDQEILEVAGSLLFRGAHVKKPISVLSGGERARLCLAGLLLSNYNVLILDEPGNHLDVDTVEALAEALLDYQGTVIFTSHDRHFTKRVATCIVEVRDGRVTQLQRRVRRLRLQGQQGDRGRRARAGHRTAPSCPPASPSRPKPRRAPRRERARRCARKSRPWSERSPSSTSRNARSTPNCMQSTDADEALRLHNEVDGRDGTARRSGRTLVPVAGRDRGE